jgi:GT2 family glycosyltransferase
MTAIEIGVLTVLLPVHNRGSLTADFILHLSKLLPEEIDLRVVIFDDGCTDETLIEVKRVWTNVEVVCLDGSAFWGGAINAISNYIRSRLSEDSIYLLANDDVRFPSQSAFLAGLREVNKSALVCATELRVKSLNANSFDKLQLTPPSAPRGIHYDHKTGNFETASTVKPANVSSTFAMLTTKDVWLSAPAIPLTIPHYLSDYWLTYKLALLGYKIVHPNDFICLEYDVSSRRGNEPIGEKKNWLSAKIDFLQSSLSKPSASYFPAWIEFLSQKPIYPSVRLKILKLKLYLLIGSFLFRRKIRI